MTLNRRAFPRCRRLEPQRNDKLPSFRTPRLLSAPREASRRARSTEALTMRAVRTIYLNHDPPLPWHIPHHRHRLLHRPLRPAHRRRPPRPPILSLDERRRPRRHQLDPHRRPHQHPGLRRNSRYAQPPPGHHRQRSQHRPQRHRPRLHHRGQRPHRHRRDGPQRSPHRRQQHHRGPEP